MQISDAQRRHDLRLRARLDRYPRSHKPTRPAQGRRMREDLPCVSSMLRCDLTRNSATRSRCWSCGPHWNWSIPSQVSRSTATCGGYGGPECSAWPKTSRMVCCVIRNQSHGYVATSRTVSCQADANPLMIGSVSRNVNEKSQLYLIQKSSRNRNRSLQAAGVKSRTAALYSSCVSKPRLVRHLPYFGASAVSPGKIGPAVAV